MQQFTGDEDLNTLPSSCMRVVGLANRFFDLIYQENDPFPERNGWIYYSLYAALLHCATSAEFPDDDAIIAAALGTYTDILNRWDN